MLLPQDDRLGDMPVASGRGVFASELDAAIEDLGPTLRRRFAEEVSDGILDPGIPRPSGARLMGADESEDADRHAIVPTEDLYEVAMLVTGRWGHLALPPIEVRASGSFKPQRRLAVFRSDEGPFERMPFSARMARLEELLEQRRLEAIESYRRREKRVPGVSTPTGASLLSSRNWVGAFSMMVRAVRFVRKQLEYAPRDRSILAASDGERRALVPFGLRWGILAGDGNQKLPFVAYSELPMATCPGAGSCGVYKKDSRSGAPASGWCYSFKAWRYPAAFTRQFLNTLAATASRAFDIELASGREEGAIS